MDEPTKLERAVAKAIEMAALDAGEHEHPNTYEYALFATEEEWLILARAAIEAAKEASQTSFVEGRDFEWSKDGEGHFIILRDGSEIRQTDDGKGFYKTGKRNPPAKVEK